MPKKHGFKEQTKVESPKKAPKPYNNYDRKGNYDIGDEFKDSDLNERIERFKKQTKVESPEKAPKTYNNYVYDSCTTNCVMPVSFVCVLFRIFTPHHYPS